MNELTIIIFSYIIVLDVIFTLVFFPVLIYLILTVFTKVKISIKNQIKIINNFYGEKITNDDLIFNSKKIKLLNLKIVFITSLILFIFIAISFTCLFGAILLAEMFDFSSNDFQVYSNYLIVPSIILGALISLYPIVLLVSWLIWLYQKDFVQEEEVILKYKDFKKIYVAEHDLDIKEIVIIKNNKYIKNYLSRSTLPKLYFKLIPEYNSDLGIVDQLREGLFILAKNINKLEKSMQKNSYTFIEAKSRNELTFVQLKPILINNVISSCIY